MKCGWQDEKLEKGNVNTILMTSLFVVPPDSIRAKKKENEKKIICDVMNGTREHHVKTCCFVLDLSSRSPRPDCCDRNSIIQRDNS